MLARASFQNFKALKAVDVDLTPFTVIVGKNGSGKTSVLRGILRCWRGVRAAADPAGGSGEVRGRHRGAADPAARRGLLPDACGHGPDAGPGRRSRGAHGPRHAHRFLDTYGLNVLRADPHGAAGEAEVSRPPSSGAPTSGAPSSVLSLFFRAAKKKEIEIAETTTVIKAMRRRSSLA